METETGRVPATDKAPAQNPIEAEKAEANSCIALGGGVAALGAGAAALSGAVCPICIVVAPGLVGAGLYKRWLIKRKTEKESSMADCCSTDGSGEKGSEKAENRGGCCSTKSGRSCCSGFKCTPCLFIWGAVAIALIGKWALGY